MICCTPTCGAEIFPPSKGDAFSTATAAGWRHWLDGKRPALPTATAFCPACLAGVAAQYAVIGVANTQHGNPDEITSDTLRQKRRGVPR